MVQLRNQNHHRDGVRRPAGHENVKTRPLLWSFRSDDKNRRDERWDQCSLKIGQGNNNDHERIAELPRYKCHKEVWALKIKDLVPETVEAVVGSDGPTSDGAMLYPEETAYAPFKVDQAYIDKHKPQVGGYYVVYQDGYK